MQGVGLHRAKIRSQVKPQLDYPLGIGFLGAVAVLALASLSMPAVQVALALLGAGLTLGVGPTVCTMLMQPYKHTLENFELEEGLMRKHNFPGTGYPMMTRWLQLLWPPRRNPS